MEEKGTIDEGLPFNNSFEGFDKEESKLESTEINVFSNPFGGSPIEQESIPFAKAESPPIVQESKD